MRFILTMLFLFFPALPVLSDGLQPGAAVRGTRKGASFTGTITGVHPAQEILLVFDRSGDTVLIPLAEVESIRALGKRRRLVLPWESSDDEPFSQFEFRTIDGSLVIGVADPEPSFDVKTGTSGVVRRMGLEELQLIETE